MTTAQPSPADPTRLRHPRLADGVEMITPGEPGAPWVIQRGTTYLRVGADLARIAAGLDGQADHATLAARLGPPWSEETVDQAVRRLDSAGLIEGSGTTIPVRKRWVVFVPPLSLQFTLLRPGAGLARLARVLPRLGDQRTRWGVSVLIAVGVVALLMQSGALLDALSTPIPWQSALVLVLAAGLTTTLHELSHGIALFQEGGRPTRIGWMLFYMVPAMFCDVSDAWRLPRPAQRVWVALAGIVTQGVIASLCAFAALLPLPDDVRNVLLILALGNLAAGVLNLVPLIRLDGYIALMSHLDLPNLRTRCIEHTRAVTAWLLFGGQRPRRDAALPTWAGTFGLASVVFPWFLVLSVLGLYLGLLRRTGLIGMLVLVAGAAYLLILLVRAVSRLIRVGRSQDARVGRTVAMLVAGCSLTALVLSTVPMQRTVSATFVTLDGTAQVVIPEGIDAPSLSSGTEVTVTQAGIVLNRYQATAEIVETVDGTVDAPAAAFLPVTVDSAATLPAHAWTVRVIEGEAPTWGAATIDVGAVPLGAWLYQTYLAVGSA